MKGRYYLGIDNGTQGLSVILCEESSMKVVATGEADYDMVPDLAEGCYEQSTADWDAALKDAMHQIHSKIADLQVVEVEVEVLGIGISGQMHGEVLADEHGNALGSVRLWCDARNEAEGAELTTLFQTTKVPKRSTCARFLWTVRNQPDRAAATRHMTTPAGWIHYRLTGEWNLGIGDASGMFPVDQSTLNYDETCLEQYSALVEKGVATASNNNVQIMPRLQSILPHICKSGEDAGCLNETGAALLGLPVGIPVAAAEGDQPAAMAGSLIAEAGMTSMSFGTSVVANAVGDRPFQGVHDGVDQFCAVDGKPINMIWIRNGTTFMNTMVHMYASALSSSNNEDGSEQNKNNDKAGFEAIMPQVIDAAPDCGGLLALPFMDDEPGVQVSKGGTAMMIGLSTSNATAGNVAKAALLASMFNLKLGSGVLDQQGYPRTEIILSGGLTKTPECSQIVADVFNCPVTLLDSGDEGSAWGGALLGKYRHLCLTEEGYKNNFSWEAFLKSTTMDGRKRYEPDPSAVLQYEAVFQRYQKLMALQESLNAAVS